MVEWEECWVKIVFLALYVVVIVGIAVYSRRHTNDLNDFFLGGRRIGPWMSAMAYGTTYFSAVVFVGYAGTVGWDFGVSATWIGLGNAILGSLCAWLLLARRTHTMSQHFGTATMPAFFQTRYQSKGLKIVTSVIIFVFLVPYTASVYTGLSYMFESAFGVPFIWCMAGIAVLTGLYLLLGGYLATAIADLFQGTIMLAGVILMLVFLLSSQQVGGLKEGLSRLGQLDPALVGPVGPGGVKNLISLIFLTSIGTWGLPQMIHKFNAIRDERAIRQGTVISTVFALIIAGGAYFMGAFGRLFFGNVAPANTDTVMPTIMETAFPPWLVGIVVILVLSASMSTLSSLVLVSSSAISMDLVKGVLRPRMEGRRVMLLMRVLCVLFVLLSVVLALRKDSTIVSLMSVSWGTISGCFLAPYLYGLYWKRATKAGAWAGVLAGLAVTAALLPILGKGQASFVGMMSMLASMVAVPLVSLVSPKLPEAHVEWVFQPEQARRRAKT
jgi:SSS family solute:Na+ symporter